MKPAREWQLFVDETGSFEGGDRSAVVGLLLQHDDPMQLDAGLRRSLQALAPELPWPLHATELRVASTVLAAWMCNRTSSPIAALLDSLAAYVEESGDSALIALREAVGARMPSRELRQAADDALAHTRPTEFAQLRARAEAIVRDVSSMCIALRTVSKPGAVVPFAAVSLESEAADRYLLALEELFERVFAQLRRPSNEPCRERVTVYAASRRVFSTALQRSLLLRPADVQQAVRGAEAFPLWQSEGAVDARVRLVSAMPVDYRLDPPAGLLLADFLANAVRFELLSPKRPLADVQRSLKQRFGLNLERVPESSVGGSALNTLATPDPWRALIRGHIESKQRPGSTPPRPAWARDSADGLHAWIEDLCARGALS